MTSHQILYVILSACLFSYVSSCTEKPGGDWTDVASRLDDGSRFLRVFLRYCGGDPIPEDQLVMAQECSYKRKLNQTAVAICDSEVFGNRTLEQMRRIKCVRKSRETFYQQFVLCYVREDPEATVQHQRFFQDFKTWPRGERATFMKQMFSNYTECYEKALNMD